MESCSTRPKNVSSPGKGGAQAFAGVIPAYDPDGEHQGWHSNRECFSPEGLATTIHELAFQYVQEYITPATLDFVGRIPEVEPLQVVIIDTMAPEQIEVFRSFHVTVKPYEDEFRADFLDANLSSFGATRNEAIWNLKDIIASTFRTLLEHEDGRLGPGLIRQLAVLRSFLRRLG